MRMGLLFTVGTIFISWGCQKERKLYRDLVHEWQKSRSEVNRGEELATTDSSPEVDVSWDGDGSSGPLEKEAWVPYGPSQDPIDLEDLGISLYTHIKNPYLLGKREFWKVFAPDVGATPLADAAVAGSEAAGLEGPGTFSAVWSGDGDEFSSFKNPVCVITPSPRGSVAVRKACAEERGNQSIVRKNHLCEGEVSPPDSAAGSTSNSGPLDDFNDNMTDYKVSCTDAFELAATLHRHLQFGPGGEKPLLEDAVKVCSISPCKENPILGDYCQYTTDLYEGRWIDKPRTASPDEVRAVGLCLNTLYGNP